MRIRISFLLFFLLFCSACTISGEVDCRKDEDCENHEVCASYECIEADGCQGCKYPETDNGTAECLRGDCRILSCDKGWFDADENARNGCECTITNEGMEICDSIDNDCNGLVDEGCTCTPTNGGVEICDNIDNDCDNKIDEDLDCVECPEDMVNIDNLYCMDIYEASRPDATASDGGSDTSMAKSVKGVIPWFNVTREQADTACKNAGKRLCNPNEWTTACAGPDKTVYSYGDDYSATICNGIDTFCRCGESGTCSDKEECPFPHCRDQCGADFKVQPTGSFPGCTNEYGVYDINGNVWEIDSSEEGRYRGGAYNCLNSEMLHRCSYSATNIAAKGFRCCK